MITPTSLTHNPSVRQIFDPYKFSSTVPPEGFMAKQPNPAVGFEPFRTEKGTEVVFTSKPAQLPPPLYHQIAPQWRNGLGLVVFRNEEANAVGAIFIHGAMKTPWSAIAPDCWQALGGIMAFSGEGTSFDEAIEMVIGKGFAMTPKWRFSDMSLKAAGHPTPTNLGGAKAIVLHGPSVDDKKKAIEVAAEVSKGIGIYISAADQNTGYDPDNEINWSDFFAERAPFNFMGARTAGKGYQGLENPSPFTAKGVFSGLRKIRERLLVGRKTPVFFQGAGGVGKVMLGLAVEEGLPISGVSDAVVQRLVDARNQGLKVPLFLDSRGTLAQFGPNRTAIEERLAARNNITVVRGLVEALEEARKMGYPTVVLSPNAGPHPMTMDVADYLIGAGIRAVCGAANNMLGLVDGSPDAVAWRLQRARVMSPNDSRINRMGAISVTTQIIDLKSIGLGYQIAQVGEDVGGEIDNAFFQDIPPQLYSDLLAAEAWNEALKEGRAVGGYFDIRPIRPPA